ncbi:MAG: DUF58 domain-containing protein [Clostridiales bacterium]|nr:DUF58 domain-containing protein [Clostridiales bacterium]
MVKNWLIYISVLIGTFIFFIFHKMWLSWACLLLVVLVPAASIIACILSTRNLRTKIESPMNTYIKKTTEIRIVSKPVLILIASYYVIHLKITDELTGNTSYKKLIGQGNISAPLKVDTDHCGVFTYEVEKLYVYDLFGLIRLTPFKNRKSEVMIRPVSKTPDKLPDLNAARSVNPVKSNSLMSENYDIREYNQGDLVKSIHWKASAKRDMLLVREALDERHENAFFSLTMCEDRDQLDRRLGEMVFVSDYYLTNGIPHTIDVIHPNGKRDTYNIRYREDLEKTITTVLHEPLDTEAAYA